MSLSLEDIVATAFTAVAAALPTAVKSITYESIGAQTYNATTGALTDTKTLYVGVTALMTQYNRKEKEGDFQGSRRMAVEFGDVKCLIPYKALPITVSMEDAIVEGTNRWRIVDHYLDPTNGALHTFHLRRS